MIIKQMDIKETFLKLTEITCPHGHEDEIIKRLPDGLNLQKDQFGNLYRRIGEPTVMFTSHLDTVGTEVKKVTHKISKEGVVTTDGTTVLGADDKAGVTIMLYMIHNGVPGLYYFFIGEERGCVGSTKLSNSRSPILKGITKAISFDREGYDSIITHQMFQRTCSEAFAKDLASKFNEYGFWYVPDETGICTDSVEFVDEIRECTNVSVGYKYHHRMTEEQDLEFLEALANGCVLVDWESLKVERDPSKSESRSSNAQYSSYGPGYVRPVTTPSTTPARAIATAPCRDFDEDEEVWEIYNEKGERIYQKATLTPQTGTPTFTSDFIQVEGGYVKDGQFYRVNLNGDVTEITDAESLVSMVNVKN